MESIKRIVMMLKSDSINQTNTAVLKLQSTKSGLAADLTGPSLPPFSLYLFDKEGNGHFTGNITGNSLHTELPLLTLDSVAAAAVIDMKTLSFLLKTSDANWPDIVARFKYKHALQRPERNVPDNTEITPQETTIYEEPPQEPTVYEEPPQEPTVEYEPPATVAADESRSCDSCPHAIRQDNINPFPSAFPNSEWVKISYPGPSGWWHYISGKIRSGETVIIKVLGVPGEYGMAPPIWLEGFGTYMRSVTPDACGYWLMFQDAETGEVLDMGLSPHGE